MRKRLVLRGKRKFKKHGGDGNEKRGMQVIRMVSNLSHMTSLSMVDISSTLYSKQPSPKISSSSVRSRKYGIVWNEVKPSRKYGMDMNNQKREILSVLQDMNLDNILEEVFGF